MSDPKKISTIEADKKRLLEALRELKKDGVTLIDDRAGRPAIISARPRADVVEEKHDPKSIEHLILDSLDQMSLEDRPANNDPYNRRPK